MLDGLLIHRQSTSWLNISPFVLSVCASCADGEEVHDRAVMAVEDVTEATMRHITGNILKGSADI